MKDEDLWNYLLNRVRSGLTDPSDERKALKGVLDLISDFLDRVAYILGDAFVPLNLEDIEEAGFEALIIPERFVDILGDSFVLKSEFESHSIFRSVLEEGRSYRRGRKKNNNDFNGLIDDLSTSEADLAYDFESFVSPVKNHKLRKGKALKHIKDESGRVYDNENTSMIEGYSCGKCSKTFKAQRLLVKHVEEECTKFRSSNKIRNRTCKICSKTFTTMKYLENVHFKKCQESMNDPIKSTLLKCSRCDKEYRTIQHYTLHVQTCGQSEEIPEKVDSRFLKDISCCKCGFIASSKEELKSSNHKCEPDKPFRCSKCDFRTCHPNSLRNHDLAIHNKDKPTHCCEICGQSYSYRTGLNHHLKTHKEKPPKLPCPHCGKLLSGPFTLNRHMESHKPPQQHPCETCGKIFVNSRYLERHIKSQHPISGKLETHECVHCHRRFREKSYLKKHIKKKHILS